jgi:lipid A 3-O-deacylase
LRNPKMPALAGLRHVPVFFCLAICLLWSSYAKAEQATDTAAQSGAGLYTQGRLSIQLVSGALFSLTGLPEDSPVFNYAQTNLRLGWMFYTPGPQESFLRGNWEGLIEISNSIIFKGFGNYIGGITGLLRYNFVQPDWDVIPYIQGGVGVVYNDAYKDETQQAIGQAIEFTPQFSLGFHYLITRKWALDGEGMFHHISNANMAKRNRSINAVGGFLGITYFFDEIWK